MTKRRMWVVLVLTALLVLLTLCWRCEHIAQNSERYYETDEWELTSASGLVYRVTLDHDNWFPVWKKLRFSGLCIEEGSPDGNPAPVYTCDVSDPPRTIIYDNRMEIPIFTAYVRSDVVFPDPVTALPLYLRPVGTNGRYDIDDPATMAAIARHPSLDAFSVDEEALTGEGYGFLCFYDGLPEYFRLVVVQPLSDGCWRITERWRICEGKSWNVTDPEKCRLIAAVFQSLEEGHVKKEFTLDCGWRADIRIWW